MNSVQFILRQHTPIVHFQWEQEGATIRPTELKSKLDKWIIRQMTGCCGLEGDRLGKAKEHPQLSKWLTGRKKDHPSFDYHVGIWVDGRNLLSDALNTRIEIREKANGERIPDVVDKDFGPYFGNQLKPEEFRNDDKKIKRLSYYSRVIIQIESVHDDLLNKISDLFPKFILHTNFGTRQSKGFGSFFLDISDPLFPKKDGETDQEYFMKSFDYCFDVQLSRGQIKAQSTNLSELTKELFNFIDLFYRTIRSGIHPGGTGFYFKSLMWKYAKSKRRQWDKRTIKQSLFNTEQMNHERLYSSDNNSPVLWNKAEKERLFLWRDILGLSTNQSWKYYKWDDRGRLKDESLEKISIDLENNLPKYTRFKSPIFFKPLRTGPTSFRVFFMVPQYMKEAFKNPSPAVPESEILGKRFKISSQGHGNFSIFFPDSFDFDDFLRYIFKTNIRKYVEQGFGNRFQNLVCIYDQLAYQAINKKSM